MESKTAQMLLDEIKKAVTVFPGNIDALIKKYGSPPDRIRQICGDFMSKYLKQYVVLPIYKAIPENELNSLKNVVVDAVPLMAINAHAIKAENGEYLVVINERLMALIHSWNELQFVALNTLKNDMDMEYFSQYFAPIINCYLNPTSANTLPVFNFDELPIEHQFCATLRTIMCEQFIIAHEFSHIYLGHCKKTAFSFSNGDFLMTYPANNENQQQEFDADIQAIKWLIALSRLDTILNPLQKSPLLYLEIFVILNLIESNIGFPKADSSHPSAIARLMNIKDYFGSEVFAMNHYSIDEMIENVKDIGSFIIRRNPFDEPNNKVF